MGTHVRLTGSARARKDGAVRVADLDPGESIEVTVTLAGPELPEPGAPLSPGDVATAPGGGHQESYRRARGARVADRGGLGLSRSLRVTGTGRADGGGVPGRPGSLSDCRREGVSWARGGAADTRRARRASHGRVRARPAAGRLSQGEPRGCRRTGASAGSQCPAAAPLLPRQVAEHYAFPKATGAGQTVAIAEFGGGYFRRPRGAMREERHPGSEGGHAERQRRPDLHTQGDSWAAREPTA